MEQQKASGFVERLINNPALAPLNPLQKEEQIAQFLSVNSRQLYPTLSSPAFFPGMDWEKIRQILMSALMQRVDQTLFPQIQHQILDRLDLSFVSLLRQQNIPGDSLKKSLGGFLSEMLRSEPVRREFSGVYNSLVNRIPDRYIDQCFDRNEYVHFELVKVQRLRMGTEEIKNLIRVSLLLKPAVYYFSVPSRGGSQEPTQHFQQPQFLDRVFQTVQKKVGAFPEEVLASALHSNLSFLENGNLEATSRIASIITGMCRSVRSDQAVDRGAETAEKSWLGVARRNFRFYGYDVKILDEFYKIAAENGW